MARKFERELKKLAARYGRRIEHGGKHMRLVCERGEFKTVFCAKTPSDRRAMKNIERELKNALPKETENDEQNP